MRLERRALGVYREAETTKLKQRNQALSSPCKALVQESQINLCSTNLSNIFKPPVLHPRAEGLVGRGSPRLITQAKSTTPDSGIFLIRSPVSA